jgi:hypothetical protein
MGVVTTVSAYGTRSIRDTMSDGNDQCSASDRLHTPARPAWHVHRTHKGRKKQLTLGISTV